MYHVDLIEWLQKLFDFVCVCLCERERDLETEQRAALGTSWTAVPPKNFRCASSNYSFEQEVKL